jgi:hypothetical protein
MQEKTKNAKPEQKGENSQSASDLEKDISSFEATEDKPVKRTSSSVDMDMDD